ncbi:MAG: GNAT family N-acetyltransferase [Bacteroidetes bacterium]|nr:GNAT family N-acetyltransferase [Bacteroidota bacterium]
MNSQLSVREIQMEDVDPIARYWTESDDAFMEGMGVDLSKLPTYDEMSGMLEMQLQQSYEDKMAYAVIWMIDGETIGHCNISPISFGKDAFIHLHLWNDEYRGKGFGTQLVKMSLPFFFDNCKLQKLLSEPYSINPAPSKTLEKVGFEFVKEYSTIPGNISFEQPVKRWELSLNKFRNS